MTAPIDISEFQADYQDTERSTAQTVAAMCQHIRQCAGDPEIRRIAGDIAGDTSYETCYWIWRWCKEHVRFMQDEEQLQKLLGRGDELELLISPSVMVRARVRQGDCDDFTMLVCSLLADQGITPLIKTYKCDRKEPWRWSHVCAAAFLENGAIIPLDASHGEYPGWQIPAQDVYESQLWDMNGNKVAGGTSRGLSGYTPEPGWTGQQSTSRGSVAGPYAQRDFSQLYGQGVRRGIGRYSGLRGIGRSKWGMGQDDSSDADGSDPFSLIPIGGTDLGSGTSVSSTSYGTSDILSALGLSPSLTGTTAGGALNSTIVYVNPDGSVSTSPTSSSSTATALGVLAAVLPAAAKLTQQAIATPGTVILPNGTIAVGTAAGTPSIGTSLSSLTSSGGVLIIALVIGGVLLVSALGKK